MPLLFASVRPDRGEASAEPSPPPIRAARPAASGPTRPQAAPTAER